MIGRGEEAHIGLVCLKDLNIFLRKELEYPLVAKVENSTLVAALKSSSLVQTL